MYCHLWIMYLVTVLLFYHIYVILFAIERVVKFPTSILPPIDGFDEGYVQSIGL